MRLVADLWKPTDKQAEAFEAAKQYRYLLYGGARGGGKSRFLRWALLAMLIRWANPKHGGHTGVRVGLFCEDYPTLKDRQITKIRAEFPTELGELKATQDEGHGFFLHPEYGGGAILLRNLDEPAKYQSAEFAAIAVEELTKNRLETFNILRASLRWPGIPDTKFIAATNPGGAGHLWVKQYWIDRDYPAELASKAEEFRFVQALPSDNPHLPDEYWQELRSQPTHIRKAWLEGSWDVFEGQAFDEWNAAVHVVDWDVPDGWTWFAGMDWGFREPSVIVLMALGPDKSVICRKEWVFRQTTPYDCGLRFGRGLSHYPLPEWIAGDSSMWAVTDGGPTYAEEFQRGLNEALHPRTVSLIAAPKGPGSRHARVMLMHKALAYKITPGKDLPDRTQLPQVRFHRDCKYLIGSIPSLPVDKNDSEDIDTHAEDHGFDAMTYAMLVRFPPAPRRTELIPQDIHPGFIPGTLERRSRIRNEETELQESIKTLAAQGQGRRGRYRRV